MSASAQGFFSCSLSLGPPHQSLNLLAIPISQSQAFAKFYFGYQFVAKPLPLHHIMICIANNGSGRQGVKSYFSKVTGGVGGSRGMGDYAQLVLYARLSRILLSCSCWFQNLLKNMLNAILILKYKPYKAPSSIGFPIITPHLVLFDACIYPNFSKIKVTSELDNQNILYNIMRNIGGRSNIATTAGFSTGKCYNYVM
ncbi:hypothetical protein EV424DRAFT_1349354 [Suillus variegatus]|nr:hypothetical protein EV424DRAFT_1349354 [Suillus variegatus]